MKDGVLIGIYAGTFSAKPGYRRRYTMSFKFRKSGSERGNLNIPLYADAPRPPRRALVLFWLIFSVVATAGIFYYRMFVYEP